ncbi:hypothetical protein ABT297_00170 [Dactylosporangium sp. NPDC000555]|uniref:hypothetical protein n=1 Tax=Dactylosporangium sp. NPDC000555 TaxID=3154260 RepID=UPI0033298131
MDLETQLRDTLTDERRALPAWDDAVARVTAGIRRRRRRRATIIASAAAVAVLPALIGTALLTARGDTGQTAAPSGSVVPWIGQPVEEHYEVKRRSPRSDAPACKGTDLSDMWTVDGTLLVGNKAMPTCTLSGRPTVTAIDTTTGQRTVVEVGALPRSPDPAHQYPATVDAGEPARLDFSVGPTCTTAVRYRDAEIDIAGRAYPFQGINLSCPIKLGEWYVQPPLMNAFLAVTMQAPATVAAGQPLMYTITIVNPQDRAMSLEPCPQVRQSLGDSAGTYLLNCAPGRLPAHSSTTFAMTIASPDRPGKVRLRWMAVFADGTVGIANLATDGVDVTVTA